MVLFNLKDALNKIFRSNNKNGYSMVVLIIAIIVILILTTVSVTSLQMSRNRTELMQFITDIQAVESEVKRYYTTYGALPRSNSDKLNIYDVANEIRDAQGVDQSVFLSQLSTNDDSNYYDIDIAKLNRLSLKDAGRGYFLNEGSLKVYVKKGVEAENSTSDSKKDVFFTLTRNLVNGQEDYISQDEEIRIFGNPTSWASEAKILVVLPNRDFSGDIIDNNSEGDRVVSNPLDLWTFKWDNGPKTIEDMRNIPETNRNKNFKYGNYLKPKSNGTYTVYVKEPEGKESIINFVVSKIDDIDPTFKFSSDGNSMTFSDNETGIKRIYFKTYKEYKDNFDNTTDNNELIDARTKVDYYLTNGKGVDIAYELQSNIDYYIKTREQIKRDLEDEEANYSKWEEELKDEEKQLMYSSGDVEDYQDKHDIFVKTKQQELENLNKEYSYLYDINGTTDESRLVVYIEDEAGNATLVGDNDFVSTQIIINSFNLNIENL